MDARFKKSGKIVSGKSADLWVRIGLAEYLEDKIEDKIIELEEDFMDNDLEDQVFIPVDEKIKKKADKPKKRGRKKK